MARTAFLIAATVLFLACRGVLAEEAAPAAPAAAPKAATESHVPAATPEAELATALDVFLAKVDAKAAMLATLEADVTATRTETFSGRKSTSTGKVYVRKPDDLFIDFTSPYPRRIWIARKAIVDYKSDLNSAEKVLISDEGEAPEIIGLSRSFGQMRDDFAMTLAEPTSDKPLFVLSLVPREGVSADFTKADVDVDAKTLVPVRIKQTDSKLDVTRTFEFSNVTENPRLSDALFKPALRSDTNVSVFKLGDWKGL